MQKQIEEIVMNMADNLVQKGVKQEIAYVSSLETMIDALTDTLMARDKTIKENYKVLTYRNLQIQDYETVIGNRLMKSTTCDFPHEWAGPIPYCPECGTLGEIVFE